jgi:hypothetical protein
MQYQLFKTKKMNNIIAAIAIMMMMTTGNASSFPDRPLKETSSTQAFDAAVNLKHDNVIEFRVINPGSEKIAMKIYSPKNNKLYQRTLHKGKALELNCDMSEFPAGTYTVVVDRGDEQVIRKEITLGAN